jgi:cysteine desulfurase family protein (TIGR01976 family)
MIAQSPGPERVASTQMIRDHFPALERRHQGHAVAYFDGPGGTQIPRNVAQAITDYLFHHNANTHWAFPSSEETDQLIAEARQTVADFLNADADEVAFGNNMTTLTFHLSRALGRRLGPGDEVVVTDLDHHANIDPWREMAAERGVRIRSVTMLEEDGQLDWEDFQNQVTGRTKVVAIGAASNALGTINDVARAARIAHEIGALVFVDAVHYAPHRLVDVKTLECDFLACSAYKFYGPHVGVLYGRGELLKSLDVPKLRPSPDRAPERLETGTQNHEGIVGTAAAIDFLASLAEGPTRRDQLESTFEALHLRASALVDRLWNGLNAIGSVTTFGPPPSSERTPTVSFVVEGLDPSDVCRGLADRGLFASHGDFYATTAIERLGRSSGGLIRVGCACYTSLEEVDRLLGAISALGNRHKSPVQ